MVRDFLSSDIGNIQAVKSQDANFFSIYTKREYYVRKIHPAEVAEGLALGQQVNEDAFVFVGQIAPGMRTRLIFTDRDNPPIAEFMMRKSQLSDFTPKQHSSNSKKKRTSSKKKRS
jgi:hypothetical protein